MLYQSAQYIPRIRARYLAEAIETMIKIYEQANFQVTIRNADNEIKCLMNVAMNHIDHSFQLQLSNPDDHVLEAERNNRTILE